MRPRSTNSATPYQMDLQQAGRQIALARKMTNLDKSSNWSLLSNKSIVTWTRFSASSSSATLSPPGITYTSEGSLQSAGLDPSIYESVQDEIEMLKSKLQFWEKRRDHLGKPR